VNCVSAGGHGAPDLGPPGPKDQVPGRQDCEDSHGSGQVSKRSAAPARSPYSQQSARIRLALRGPAVDRFPAHSEAFSTAPDACLHVLRDQSPSVATGRLGRTASIAASAYNEPTGQSAPMIVAPLAVDLRKRLGRPVVFEYRGDRGGRPINSRARRLARALWRWPGFLRLIPYQAALVLRRHPPKRRRHDCEDAACRYPG